MSSRWAVIERYSPAAMEKEPAISPATPASRTIEAAGIGARDTEHERDVGDQTVADPENGRPGPTAPDITVLVDWHGSCSCTSVGPWPSA